MDFDWENCIDTLKSHGKDRNCAVVLLNHCFDTIISKFDSIDKFLNDEKFENFQEIWNNSSVRLIVDGGANYFHDIQQHESTKSFDPDFIVGDFDSIKPNVMEYFKKNSNIEIIHTPDQDYTDFTKALFILNDEVLNNSMKNIKIDYCLVFFSNSGRIDQYLSILSTIHYFSNNFETFPPIILIDLVDSISIVLKKGKHRIPRIIDANWCSLIPLCGSVKLNTKGLRWNLNENDDNNELEFGRFISSSNEFDKNFNEIIIDVINDKRSILFSTEFHL